MKYLKICSLAVVLMALAAAPAVAQECAANVTSKNVRSEGVTELVGDITLKCRGPRTLDADDALTFGNTAPKALAIKVTLNADITNELDSSDMVMDGDEPGYSDGNVNLTANTLNADQTTLAVIELGGADATVTTDDLLSSGEVADNLRSVTWKVLDTDSTTDGNQGLGAFNVGGEMANADGSNDTDVNGFQLVIKGLRADASAVGAGNSITATVAVNGTTVGTADMKVAGVMNGLDPVVTAAKGKECDDVSGAMATVTLKEGFKKGGANGAFQPMDRFMLTFTNIPEGVTVMVPMEVPLADPVANTRADEVAESFTLNLVQGTPGDGVGDTGDGGKVMVELSASGSGEIRYTIGTKEVATAGDDGTLGTDDDGTDDVTSVGDSDEYEWAHIPVYFSWDGGAVSMNADAMVHASFHPSGGSMIPRFSDDGSPAGVLMVEDCVGKLTFPFVTTLSGFDTGIVVSNTNDASGTCTASYSRQEETVTSPVIEGNSDWIFLVGAHHNISDYTGRLTVSCEFTGIDGYAHVANDETSNGYLPRRE